MQGNTHYIYNRGCIMLLWNLHGGHSPNRKRGAFFMEDKILPNYYAILTADVRYDKNLSPNAKLLYAEITALSNKEGFCWATNEYFAKLYSLSSNRISRLVSSLVANKYITVEIANKFDRKIYLSTGNSVKLSTPLVKNNKPPCYKQQTPLVKNNNIILQDNIKKNKTLSEIEIEKKYSFKSSKIPSYVKETRG